MPMKKVCNNEQPVPLHFGYMQNNRLRTCPALLSISVLWQRSERPWNVVTRPKGTRLQSPVFRPAAKEEIHS